MRLIVRCAWHAADSGALGRSASRRLECGDCADLGGRCAAWCAGRRSGHVSGGEAAPAARARIGAGALPARAGDARAAGSRCGAWSGARLGQRLDGRCGSAGHGPGLGPVASIGDLDALSGSRRPARSVPLPAPARIHGSPGSRERTRKCGSASPARPRRVRGRDKAAVELRPTVQLALDAIREAEQALYRLTIGGQESEAP